MLQPPHQGLPRNLNPGSFSGRTSGPDGIISGGVNRALGNGQCVQKRQRNCPVDSQEPAIKQEKVDSSYDAAFSQELATLLGTVDQGPRPAGLTGPVAVPNAVGQRPLNHTQRGKGRANRQKPATALGNFLIAQRTNGGKKAGSGLVRLAPRVTAAPSMPNSGVPTTATFPDQSVSTASTVQIIPELNSSTVLYISRPSRQALVEAGRTAASSLSSAFPRPIVHLQSATAPPNRMVPGCSELVKSVLANSAMVARTAAETGPPAELHLSARPNHVCMGCGSAFRSDGGLADHTNRRSMVLSFRCICAGSSEPVLFYNPCTYNAFYQSHSRRPGVHVSRESVTVSVLELDTPEYRACLEQRKEKEVGGKEADQNSEVRGRRHTNTAAGSDCNGQPASTSTEGHNGGQSVPEDQSTDLQNSSRVTDATATDGLENNSTDKTSLNSRSQVRNGRKARLPQSSSGDCRIADFFVALNHNRVACLECTSVYTTRGWLATHFTSDRASHTSLKCSLCPLILPNPCSRTAHIRLHKDARPFVCPQCGLAFDEADSVDVFQAHVERHCLHLLPSDSGLSTCSRCSFQTSEPNEDQMIQHFLDEHLATYHKCGSCPKAFANVGAADRHGDSTGHDARKHVVWKCPLCDTVFRAETEKRKHMSEHLSGAAMKCPVCPMSGKSRATVVEHLRSAHPDDVLPATTCEVCGRRESSRTELFNHVSLKHPRYFDAVMKCLPADSSQQGSFVSEGKSVTAVNSAKVSSASAEESVGSKPDTPVSQKVFECSRCQMTFQSKDAYRRHKAKHRFLELKKARKRQKAATATAESTGGDPLLQVPLRNEYTCTRCCQKFDSADQLDQHFTAVHGSPRWLWCQLCAAGFPTGKTLQRHLEARHHGKDQSSLAFTCTICSPPETSDPVSFCAQAVLTKHLQSVHKMSRTAAALTSRASLPLGDSERVRTEIGLSQTSESSPDDQADTETPEPARSLFVSGKTAHYQCSRCEFSDDDRSVFVRHAAEHRLPPPAMAVQCVECSASFTAPKSLGWHLRVVHNIATHNVDDYLVENGGRPPRPVTPEETLELDVQDASPSSTLSAETRSAFSDESPSGKSQTPVGKPATVDDDEGPAECTVCYRVFFSKQLLRNHMRGHGMAFIQRTRRRLTS